MKSHTNKSLLRTKQNCCVTDGDDRDDPRHCRNGNVKCDYSKWLNTNACDSNMRWCSNIVEYQRETCECGLFGEIDEKPCKRNDDDDDDDDDCSQYPDLRVYYVDTTISEENRVSSTPTFDEENKLAMCQGPADD